MQVDCCAWVVSIFQRVHKLFGDLLSKRHIIAAASPNPPFTTWTINSTHVISLQEQKSILNLD